MSEMQKYEKATVLSISGISGPTPQIKQVDPFSRFDVDAQIKEQFADVLASNEKWEKRITSEHRDLAAERKEDEGAEDGLNSPDIKVVYWQTPRIPSLAKAMMTINMLLFYLAMRSPLANQFSKLASALLRPVGLGNAELHKKLLSSLRREWDGNLIWEVSMNTNGRLTVSEGFSGWSTAIKENKFPGRNIPRIAFQRME